jgi:V8-like Glu-specific endopeptidase
MTTQQLFATCRSGVAQMTLEVQGEEVSGGTAFLVPGGLVTNSHVIRGTGFDVCVLRFDDMGLDAGIRLAKDDCLDTVAHESPSDEHDFAFLELNEPEFAGRHVFAFGDSASVSVGDEVGFLGYPFRKQHLTCHLGHVSSVHRSGQAQAIQVDASVNGGNSGGPLLELTHGDVIGVVSRAEVGFLADQFDELIRALSSNIALLQQPQAGRIVISGLDPIQTALASQVAMREIAVNLRRSANVGIGYALGTDELRQRLTGS